MSFYKLRTFLGRSDQPVAITENTLANTKEPQPGTDNTWIVGGIVFGIAVILGIVITIYFVQRKK